jgi:hypothetical protein
MGQRGWKGLTIAVLALAATASATVVRRLTMDELAASSPVVVRGVVVEQQVRASDASAGRLETLTEIRVTDRLRGESNATLLVRQPGGELAGVGHDVSGRARFQKGEDVLLFLEPAADDATVYLVRGMSSGKVRFEKSHTGELRAVRDLQGLALYDDRASVPAQRFVVMDKEDLGEATAFVSAMRKAARSGKAVTR